MSRRAADQRTARRRNEAASASLTADPAFGVIFDLARALANFGAPSHRLEDAMTLCCEHLGVRGQFFSTPTCVVATLGEGPRQEVALISVEPGEVNLERLVLADEILAGLAFGRISMGEARRRLDALFIKPKRWGEAAPIVCSGAISAAVARFFGGGVYDIIVAGVVGVIVGALAFLAARRVSSKRLTDFLAGASAALIALAVAASGVPISTQIVTIAGVIILLPGLTLTLAMNELAMRHLVSGTARLFGAMTILISIGLGIAIGRTIGGGLAQPAPNPAGALPWWTELLALIVAPIALTVVFQARRRDLWIVTVTSLIGFTIARTATVEFGTELGVFLAAAAVGATSNAFARIAKRPSAVAMLPGITLLVPGSLGLRSVDSFLGKNALVGVETAFTMLIIASALVAGLLAANVIVPPRQAL